MKRIKTKPKGYDEGTLDHEVGQLIIQAQRAAYANTAAGQCRTESDMRAARHESAMLEAFEDYFCARWGRDR